MADIENLTIMFTDIVDFSNMVSSLSRKESEDILKSHDRLLRKEVKRFGGTYIKSVGDSFLVVFRSPTDAVLCSMAMQDALWAFNHGDNYDFEIIIRVALNTGEVRLANGDVFGEAVNIAARLESKTPAGAIYLTETVYLSMNKNEVQLNKIGEKQFKGIGHTVTIYQARSKKDNNNDSKYNTFPYGGAHKLLKPAGRSFFTFGKVFIGLTTAIITAFFSWWITITYMPSPNSIELDKLAVSHRDPNAIIEVNSVIPNVTTEIRSQAKTFVENKNYVSLKALIEQYQEQYPDNAYLNMLQGHSNTYFKDYKNAIKHYEIALKGNSSLSNDALLSNNLVKLLGQERLDANRIIAKYLSAPMVDALAKRTGQKGLRTRYDAFYLLKDSGNLKKVDTVGLNIWDLKELKECKLKKVAVKELKRLNNPRALPALKELENVNFWKSFKYFCLHSELEAAITQLEKKAKPTEKPEPASAEQ